MESTNKWKQTCFQLGLVSWKTLFSTKVRPVFICVKHIHVCHLPWDRGDVVMLIGKQRWKGAEAGPFSQHICIYVCVYIQSWQKLSKSQPRKRFFMKVVLTLVDGTISGSNWNMKLQETNYKAMPFTQCVGITHNAFTLHHPSLYPNSNYRHMIYLPPQFSPSGLLWLLISTAAILKSGKTGKTDAEKGGLHFKLALFKVWSHQAALAPGKLLEMQILGPNPSLPESESLGHLGGGRWGRGAQEAVFSPTLLVFAKAKVWEAWSKVLFTPFQNSLRHYLGGNWVSGTHGGGFSLFIFLYLKNFFSAMWLTCYFNRNKNDQQINRTSTKSTLKRKG